MTSDNSRDDFEKFFVEDAEPQGWGGAAAQNGDGPSGLDAQLAAYSDRQRRYIRSLVLTAATFSAVVWFLWDYRQDAAYAFAPPRDPKSFGNVENFDAKELPLGEYVTVTGITEHRGLTQQKVRGLGVSRQELWYFRLLGSGGLFIEVEADGKKFGFVTETTVSGRVIDPAKTSGYGSLLADYYKRFSSRRRTGIRIIQAGVAPGEGRGGFYVAGFILLLLVISNLWITTQWIILRRKFAGRGNAPLPSTARKARLSKVTRAHRRK